MKIVLSLMASVMLAYASDPTGVYARVDKVALEPNAESAETIQIWGVFSLAKSDDRSDYLPAARGYLYVKLANNKNAARKEWADLKEIAGTGQIVGFGSRYEGRPRLRKADERPENPDPFSTNIGLQKVRSRTDWPPIRAILDYRD